MSPVIFDQGPPYWPHLTLMTSLKTIPLSTVTFWGTGDQDFNIGTWRGDIFHPIILYSWWTGVFVAPSPNPKRIIHTLEKLGGGHYDFAEILANTGAPCHSPTTPQSRCSPATDSCQRSPQGRRTWERRHGLQNGFPRVPLWRVMGRPKAWRIDQIFVPF